MHTEISLLIITTLASGTRLTRYEIKSLLGAGGMGEVFLSEETREESVALVIENGEHKGKAGDGQFLKRGTCVKIWKAIRDLGLLSLCCK